MPTRQQMWDRLGDEVDVLIVGGGINGAGIARDAAGRGLKVALAEMNDFAFGTSSRSSKLIHGGLRYLEHYEFSMVFESVSERRTLMDLAPHLVNPLGFLFPVYEGSRRRLATVNAGMWIYDGLALFRSPKNHKVIKTSDVATVEPALSTKGLKGAPLYYDCSTDDARLTLETMLDAVARGAVACSGARVERFMLDERARVEGAEIKSTLAGPSEGQTKRVRAKVVINATGPWTDSVRAMSPTPGRTTKPVLRPTKGVHVVVDAARLPLRHAVVCFHPQDERVLFALPWGDRTYIGTTDTDYSGDPEDAAATLEDVEYLLAAANAYFPAYQLQKEHVISTWAGLRPLVASGDQGVDESSVSREHEVIVGRNGLITIAGGKLTTYRRVAAEVVDQAERLLRLSGALKGRLRRSRTDEDPLPGGVGWPEDDDHDKVATQVADAARGALSQAVARNLANTYGMRAIALATKVASAPELAMPLLPGRPEILAQVDWAVEEELAASVSDVLVRRTQIFYRDENQGLGCLNAVCDRMAERLGWDQAERTRNIREYQREVAQSRQWRDRE